MLPDKLHPLHEHDTALARPCRAGLESTTHEGAYASPNMKNHKFTISLQYLRKNYKFTTRNDMIDHIWDLRYDKSQVHTIHNIPPLLKLGFPRNTSSSHSKHNNSQPSRSGYLCAGHRDDIVVSSRSGTPVLEHRFLTDQDNSQGRLAKEGGNKQIRRTSDQTQTSRIG